MSSQHKRVLGIDLGTNSVGWSLIRLNEEGVPCGIEAMGVRCFEAGVEGDIQQGRDASRAAVRREKRAARRMLARRARRTKKVFGVLQKAGLLPTGQWSTSEQRDAILKTLDEQLRAKWLEEGDHLGHQVLPYRLRAEAVKRPVEPLELGRAIYHLAQRRGFKSNRKTDRKDKEQGVVKEGIKSLAEDMQGAGCGYLGEYFATLDPDVRRIRQRWTSRGMYEAEFGRIMEVQKTTHSDALTDDYVRELRRAIFRQRPLKPQSHLIGECELEPAHKRAPLALPVAQRFRMLAAVNNLDVYEPSGISRPLSGEERSKVLEALEHDGDHTFDALRKLLGLTKTRKSKGEIKLGHEFNLERDGGESKLCGNRTASQLRRVFGERWDTMGEAEQERIVHEMLQIEREESLVRRAKDAWGLAGAQIEQLKLAKLEDDRAAFSAAALRKLVAGMMDGTHFATAKKAAYGGTKVVEPMTALPPVLEQVNDLRNPAVTRSLSEMRKVVNGLLRKYGQPACIRVELARDLKRGRKEREAVWKRSREREMDRTRVKELVRQHGGNPDSRSDVEKYLLMIECCETCPYTGRIISPGNLFGDNSQFDIEHIIPFSKSLDNSFGNKTLCWAEFNRHHKKNRSPMEAIESNSQEWHEVTARVQRFQGDAARTKLRRFLMTPEEVQAYYSDFTERHLADTRYASRLAADYLGSLYGGVCDASGRRRVFASSGSVTAFLRSEWELNGLLSGGAEKTRKDHRHHAVDATVIALSEPGVVKALSDAASQAGVVGRRLFAPMKAPWSGLQQEIRATLPQVVVSHRMDHRIAGPLHAETNYSRAIRGNGAATGVERHRRKSLDQLSKTEAARIADPQVRKAVEEVLGSGDPKQVFKNIGRADVTSGKVPCLKTKDGRLIPIRRVRVIVEEHPFSVGKGFRTRHVTSGKDTLHHVVIISESTKKGERWTCHAVDRIDVYTRLAKQEPVIQTDWGEGKRLVMALHKGDCIEMDEGDGRALYLVKRATEGDIVIRRLTDARTDDEIGKAGDRNALRIRSTDVLRTRNAAVVTISPIGEVKRGS